MTNGTDSDSVPVADPTPGGDGDGTRWPTWSDISRLHHIPSAHQGGDGPSTPRDEAEATPVAEASEQAPEDAPEARDVVEGTEPPDRIPGSAPAETVAPAENVPPAETVTGGDVEQAGTAAETRIANEPAQASDGASALAVPPSTPDGPVAPHAVAPDAAVDADAPIAPDAPVAADRPVAQDAPVADGTPEPVTGPRDPTVETASGGSPAPVDAPVHAPADAPEVPTTAAEPDVVAPAVPGEPTAATAMPSRTSAFPATAAGGSSSPHVRAGAVPVVNRETSVLDDFEPDDGRRRWPRQLAVVLGIVVVLVGAYAGACYTLGHRVPRGATVAGVDIGGLTEAAAVDRLTGRLGPATSGALAVAAGSQQSQLDPARAGLTFDAAATVRRLVGVDLLQPVRLWDQVVGVGAQPAVTAVDAGALHSVVQQLADSLQVAPVNGSIVFADGTAHATPAQDGTDLDVPGAEKTIRDGWLVGARPLVLPTRSVAPDITQAETDAALTEVAQRVAGAPVTVTVADRTVSLPASTLVANASFVAQDGKLVLQLNGPNLVAAVLAQTPGLVTPASDARFDFQNDAPVLVPGTPGTTIDPNAVAAAVATAASSPTQRTATVSLVPSDPAQSTAALQALGIKEIVSEFATPLTSEPHRTVNITVGASKINGVLVRPGDTFSLGTALSPIDAAHGYIDAGAIVDGDHVQALGGGLSQISTTTYNAAFFAGFEDVAHTPHSEWFTRYPEGREATIFVPTLDMKWKNNTPYGALIQAWVADNQVHVRIWGTKYWTVTSTTSPRSNVHAPTTVYSQSPACTPQSAGNPGFTVTVTRQLSLNGEVKQSTSRTTTYKPQDTIICGPAPGGASPSPTS
ncbi:hypothetical protein CELL_02324 [Cellulomonas sp. T2.31MG-18]|uniref:VanW family protein n=1 Tax=Cellulomonas sp. T2.31MG-18 TaxID=3157619 RepID=UPI0035E6E858